MAFRKHPKLRNKYLTSICYHDIFKFPLKLEELDFWYSPIKLKKTKKPIIAVSRGYAFIKGREFSVNERIKREKIYYKKMKIARKWSSVIGKIPFVQMIGLTGSLSMKNATKESDIDFLIITSKGLLWTTRFLVYTLLFFLRAPLRHPGQKEEEDKLCLNMWIDETDLAFGNKNIFTAHEIAQIVPIFNKNNTHEKLIHANSWVVKFWPNSVKIRKVKNEKTNEIGSTFSFLENLLREIQYFYMKSKMSREVVTKKRAFFHPFDWGKKILKIL